MRHEIKDIHYPSENDQSISTWENQSQLQEESTRIGAFQNISRGIERFKIEDSQVDHYFQKI